ncbi:MAG: molybdopterin biosynthesis protein [Desulfamplus sp.]|nr:molybdopterin biosynthesis protein [Desulfamplus sp.]
MRSIDSARQILFEKFEHCTKGAVEEIDAVDALGRVLAEPGVAALSSPNYHAAAMDGIAIDAAASFGASELSPVSLVPGKDAFWINTGHVMPAGTNAVIMIENINVIDTPDNAIDTPDNAIDTPDNAIDTPDNTINTPDNAIDTPDNTIDTPDNAIDTPDNAIDTPDNTIDLPDRGTRIEIEAPAFPWQNVRKMGEDIVATELIFPRGHQVTPYSIGALVSGGMFRIKVKKRPGVLIIPTGSELKSWQDARDRGLLPGEVVESNAGVLGALCVEYGAIFHRHETIGDNLESITRAVRDAAGMSDGDSVGGGVPKYDMIFIIGGSSAGSRDYSRPVISTLGEVYVHGITMMPGKPLLFGGVNGIPVFGIPGYPVSAIVAFEQFAGPLLLKMQGLLPTARERDTIEVLPARKITSKLGLEEFLRVKIGSVEDRFVASQLPRGAGSITTLTQADGIIRIPAHVEGIDQGVPVRAELIRPVSAIKNTAVIVGSHDNTIDVMADEIRKSRPDVEISSSHVGSMGGLMAIKKGVCHLAGTHLLDPDDGSYNISYIKKYLAGMKLHLINLVMRDQGLIVPGGNPKGIRGMEDLARDDISFINRQGGSGTRILLDYKLKEIGMDSGDISGYDNEEYTHMSVAAAVLSGRADAGLGICAAARALGLEFIPVVTESYDLLIPDKFFHIKPVEVLLETIVSQDFKKRVRSLGGYGTQRTGEVVFTIL